MLAKRLYSGAKENVVDLLRLKELYWQVRNYSDWVFNSKLGAVSSSVSLLVGATIYTYSQGVSYIVLAFSFMLAILSVNSFINVIRCRKQLINDMGEINFSKQTLRDIERAYFKSLREA